MRRILFVDDEQRVLNGLERLIQRQRQPWDVSFASSGEAALALLRRDRYDVIVSDMRMPGMDGVRLLEEVRVRYPHVARIILTGYADLEAALRAVRVAHQYLIKPCDTKTLSSAVERAYALQSVLSSTTLIRILGSIGDLPCTPNAHAALRGLLAEPDPALERVAHIIEQDVSLSAKVLQLSNSAFFGVARNLSTVRDAVNHLGANNIRRLVLSEGAFECLMPSGLEAFSLEQFQRHAQMVARVAATFPLPSHLTEAAAMAGLLHDIGELVLASRLPTAFRTALEKARQSQRPVHEVEEEQYGVSHAEVGAYLLSLWGFSALVTEAVAHHHRPHRIPRCGLDAVAAVYLADHIAHELQENTDNPVSPVLLRDLGIADQYPAIRERTRWEFSKQQVVEMPAALGAEHTQAS